MWQAGADELNVYSYKVQEAQTAYGEQEYGEDRTRIFCLGRNTLKLNVLVAVQGLTSLASQLVVALNVRNHRYALKLLGSIWQITMKSIQQNGGVKG